MIDLLNNLKDTPVPAIIVIFGIIFILGAIAGGLDLLKIPPLRFLWQRWTLGGIGSLLLILGLLLYLLPTFSGSNPGNIVRNGDFEIPTLSGQYKTFNPGDTLGAWTVEDNPVDLVATYWAAYSGNQSVDLDGPKNGVSGGSIFQDLNMVGGRQYTLRFVMAGNPLPDPLCGDAIKVMEVWWGSSLLATLSFDTTGKTFTSMGWTPYQYSVTATSDTTRLRFTSQTVGSCGPAIDFVSVK